MRHDYADSLGFTLIEVLIAMIILAIGLLGIAGLQVNALHRTNEAYLLSLAVIEFDEMMERLNVGDDDSIEWSVRCANSLPKGKCRCQKSGSSYQIDICWYEEIKGKECIHW